MLRISPDFLTLVRAIGDARVPASEADYPPLVIQPYNFVLLGRSYERLPGEDLTSWTGIEAALQHRSLSNPHLQELAPHLLALRNSEARVSACFLPFDDPHKPLCISRFQAAVRKSHRPDGSVEYLIKSLVVRKVDSTTVLCLDGKPVGGDWTKLSEGVRVSVCKPRPARLAYLAAQAVADEESRRTGQHVAPKWPALQLCESDCAVEYVFTRHNVPVVLVDPRLFAPMPAVAAAPAAAPKRKAPADEAEGAPAAKQAKLNTDCMEELNCVICSELLHKSVLTPCSHSFCLTCMLRWLNKAKSCPTCRKACTREQLRPQITMNKLIDVMVASMSDEAKAERLQHTATLDAQEAAAAAAAKKEDSSSDDSSSDEEEPRIVYSVDVPRADAAAQVCGCCSLRITHNDLRLSHGSRHGGFSHLRCWVRTYGRPRLNRHLLRGVGFLSAEHRRQVNVLLDEDNSSSDEEEVAPAPRVDTYAISAPVSRQLMDCMVCWRPMRGGQLCLRHTVKEGENVAYWTDYHLSCWLQRYPARRLTIRAELQGVDALTVEQRRELDELLLPVVPIAPARVEPPAAAAAAAVVPIYDILATAYDLPRSCGICQQTIRADELVIRDQQTFRSSHLACWTASPDRPRLLREQVRVMWLSAEQRRELDQLLPPAAPVAPARVEPPAAAAAAAAPVPAPDFHWERVREGFVHASTVCADCPWCTLSIEAGQLCVSVKESRLGERYIYHAKCRLMDGNNSLIFRAQLRGIDALSAEHRRELDALLLLI